MSFMALADGVTIGGDLQITIGGFTGGGGQSSDAALLQLSADMLHAFDVANIQLTGNGHATVIADKRFDGTYLSAFATLPITTSTGNSTEPVIESVTLNSGLTLNSPTGNALTFSNLVINTQTHQVNASVLGSNGVGSIDSLLLWRAETVQTTLVKSTPISGGAEVRDYSVSLTGLTWSDASRLAFGQALGLDPVAQSAWNAVQDAGTLSLNIQTVSPTAVPESSTTWLMGIGLMGLVWTTRQRKTH